MCAELTVPAGDLVLDEQAIAAFVNEIVDVVPNVALTSIYGPDGAVLWQHSFQFGSQELANSQLGDAPLEARKRQLGGGNYAFDFPLQCANVHGCILTVIVYTLDPPSLMTMTYQTSQMLACIARQIDVDASLGTTRITKAAITAPALLHDLSASPSTTDSGQLELQGLVDQCLEESNAACVAIVSPVRNTLTIRSKSGFESTSINKISARLNEVLVRERRVVRTRITLPDGQRYHAVCAPMLGKQQSLDGLALLIALESDAQHSKIVRFLANGANKLLHAQTSDSKLSNRFELVAAINAVVQRQPATTHSLIYFDADKTHTINDAFGYSGGDRALETLRRILFDCAGANDTVSHLGGDRFAMFLPGASGDTAVAKATQVLQFLAQECIDDGAKTINLSASAGIVDTAAATKGAEDMLVLSEVASRGAQERGGNQCALFQDIDSSIIQRRSDVDKVGFLQTALIENRFVLHAQRIEAINADAGQKFELLARLGDEEGVGSSPAQFLSAAERYQLMAALDRWVINSALVSIANAENTLEASLSTFCINVSAQSLRDEAFVDFIEARIAETGVPPDTLCFEITETSLVRHIERAQKFVYRLQRLGCLVALDDFGTGYSSFAYLKTLPVNFLKIDGAFVRDLLENELSQTIVKAVVSIADVIGAQTVAEHVENSLVQAWLRNAGVHFVQGFVVHRPEPLSDVLAGLGSMSGIFGNDVSNIDLRYEVDDGMSSAIESK